MHTSDEQAECSTLSMTFQNGTNNEGDIFQLKCQEGKYLKEYISTRYKEEEYFQERKLRAATRAKATQVNSDIFKLASRIYHFPLLNK